jgi:hypothetical protein
LNVGYFVVDPEGSGRPIGQASEPSCTFDTWLGDDLVSAHPLLLVTTRLKESLLELSQPTGFSFALARTTRSPFFERHDPDRALPTFWSVRVDGQPGVDDLGMGRGGSLVASSRVVEAMGRFSLKHATLSQYTGSGVGEGSDSHLVSR